MLRLQSLLRSVLQARWLLLLLAPLLLCEQFNHQLLGVDLHSMYGALGIWVFAHNGDLGLAGEDLGGTNTLLYDLRSIETIHVGR
jgi:hypothetical protein